MEENYEYYFNNTPESGLVRNNLIYTSLISTNKKTFVQWYFNDQNYHGGRNEVLDPALMDIKWNKEVKYLSIMAEKYPEFVSELITFDHKEKKIYHSIDGVDLWQRTLDNNCSFDEILPDWQDQMLSIIEAHKSLGIYKYSMHPSSYFIVNGKLKSINYFFCYNDNDGMITVREHLSHISLNRRKELFLKMEKMNIDVDAPKDLKTMQMLCFESFRSNYPADFIERAKLVYV
jgi:hypothetical protein